MKLVDIFWKRFTCSKFPCHWELNKDKKITIEGYSIDIAHDTWQNSNITRSLSLYQVFFQLLIPNNLSILGPIVTDPFQKHKPRDHYNDQWNHDQPDPFHGISNKDQPLSLE